MVRLVQPEVTFILQDPRAVWQYLFENPFDREGTLLNAAPVLAYLPVDGYDYPPQLVELLPIHTNIVAMSRHGQSVFPGAKLVYHGVDPELFWPVTDTPIDLDGPVLTTKRECKAILGLDPDRFLVLRVDKNSGRKDFAATINAVAPLLETHRDMALHLHAMQDAMMPGVDIPALLTRYDLAPNQVTTSGLDSSTSAWHQDRLNILYNAADVFITTSRGEGFGLTIAEALSCGVPVIAQDISAIPEVVGPGGILIPPQRRITTPAGQDNWLADINAFTEALEKLYLNEVWRHELGRAGRKHVTESFSWDFAVDRFHDFIVPLARWRASTEATT
jgi:glycosyltransferase involved in cell wall biosynthesis